MPLREAVRKKIVDFEDIVLIRETTLPTHPLEDAFFIFNFDKLT